MLPTNRRPLLILLAYAALHLLFMILLRQKMGDGTEYWFGRLALLPLDILVWQYCRKLDAHINDTK